MREVRASRSGAARPLLRASGIEKIYKVGDQEVRALDGVSLDIDIGEFVAIMGSSGSGKSTMMNLIGALDVPTSGRLELLGHDLAGLGPNQLADLRNRSIGFVFQQFNLLARTSALRQVMLPMSYGSRVHSDPEARARGRLADVYLADRLDHLPSQLSGGQQQRVAIARALANDPQLLLADEPTGALDTRTSEEIMRLFCELNETGITVIVVTHEPDVAAYARRIVTFRDGRIISDVRNDPRPAGNVS
jgi:putative ABC transport system ATP-binding protein